MSDWMLRVPYRDRREPLDADAIIDLPQALEGDDRLVCRSILMSLHGVLATVGDVLDGFELMTKAERRACLDSVRQRIGLESASDLDAHERFRAAQDMARRRVPSQEPPRLAAGGGIEIALSPAELAAAQREDELREQAERQRREEREHEARERQAAEEARASRWRFGGPGWEPAP